MSPAWVIWAPALVASTSVPALAAVYLTVEEAQQLIFPDRNFTLVPVTLSEDQRKTVQEKSGIPVRARQERVWRTDEGGHLIIDDVIGKHEFITFAVGINPDGSVRQVEILNYREAYGFEVRQKKWRRQFIGKTGASELSLNDDIKNISGATLSCRHVTEGVKRALALYDLIIKK
ncbi:MAG: FMN-binding protein [Candidatus Omnitrophota bacterium]|nr:FMN-binding protein [Candidatus Omnitrophota bacterium]MDZ4242673.1 FMN-binding protein [Candidatus Omnitrophota bacterium]